MFKNYFYASINVLFKNKVYSLINISALAVGLMAFILIDLYVIDERSFDSHWYNADQIYRINQEIAWEDGAEQLAPTSLLLLPALKKFFSSEIKYGSRLVQKFGEIEIGNSRFSGVRNAVDEDFIKIFQFEVLEGRLDSTFENSNSIALSEESATNYFGNRNAVGEVVTFYSNEEPVEYRVTAVYRFAKGNTVLRLPNLTFLDDAKFSSQWLAIDGETFIRLGDEISIRNISAQLEAFTEQNASYPPGAFSQGQRVSEVIRYQPQKISDIYFNPYSNPNQSQPSPSANRSTIEIFMSISILVLLIGCTNFVILSTARASHRAKEVAVRKAVGAEGQQLMLQFFGESFSFVFIALLLAPVGVQFLLPFFNNFVNKALEISYSEPLTYLSLVFLLVIVALLGGAYPALVLSKFSPARTLGAKQSTEVHGAISVRKILVLFQFAASIALIICTAIIYGQLLFIGKIPPGYDPENLFVVEDISRAEVRPYKDTLIQEIKDLPEVVDAAFSRLQPNDSVNNSTSVQLYRAAGSIARGKGFPIVEVGYEFFKTYRIPFLSGREFERGRDREEKNFRRLRDQDRETFLAQECHVIVNEAAASQLGVNVLEVDSGQYIEREGVEPDEYVGCLVIAVVADSQFRTVRAKPEPEIYHLYPDVSNYLTVRFNGDPQSIVRSVQNVWGKVVNNAVFSVNFVNQSLNHTFQRESYEARLLLTFSVLAVFIACISLYGMATFTMDTRVKEIGIRKVMGARTNDIVQLLVWEFLKPVLAANVIAWPIALWSMLIWLGRFPYQIGSWVLIPISVAA
ncbi:MAG: ABC transporter permease, partial [Pseudomonadales bacterium]|nr:ABC transporter permease [Pseudomonadales bacterium]